MRIYVAGGLHPDRPQDADAARLLGAAIGAAGHVLLQGWFNSFDRAVAQGAFAAAANSGRFASPRLAVQSFVTQDTAAPGDAPWLVRRLSIRDWDPGEERWCVPEPIEACDAAIVLGGGAKTLRAANLCRLAGKPLVPITALGGAAAEVFHTELDRFAKAYEGRVARNDYALLDTQGGADFADIAADAVRLAVRLALGSSVFVVMAFRAELDDTFRTIQAVCAAHGLTCLRTDKDPTTARIYPRIVGGIRRAALVVADVTIQTTNVYYELGYAEALDRPVIVIAREGTELPFDTRDIPTTLFVDQAELKVALHERFAALLDATR